MVKPSVRISVQTEILFRQRKYAKKGVAAKSCDNSFYKLKP
jgi:hypothetical protein